MKTKITTLLIASFFFLSVSSFADDFQSNQKTKNEIKRTPGDIMPYFDSFKQTIKYIIDYTRPPWWIGSPLVDSSSEE